MRTFFLRLDDASEYMSIPNWERVETILDSYGIKPLVGVIPHCEDTSITGKYEKDPDFWERVHRWHSKGWTVALHGYNHVYSSRCGGINPVNIRSEFAGVPLEIQKDKIVKGVSIFRKHGIEPHVFFAPAHTFDINTLDALRENSNIRIISDTVADKSYCYQGFTFVPQQAGAVRNLPFNTVTFCYHPNTMQDSDFLKLEKFLVQNLNLFHPFQLIYSKRRLSLYDRLLRTLYFSIRKFRK